MAFTVVGPVTECIEGRAHHSWLVTETVDGGSSDEFEIDGFPTYGTITLYQAELTPAGDTTTIAPELGLAPGFADDSIDAVACVGKPAAHVVVRTPVRVTAWGGKLFGRSKPNGTQVGTTVTTRITVVGGHR